MASELLKDSPAEKIISYLLEESLGLMPKTKSILNKKDNNVSYIATILNKQANLTTTFGDIQIHNAIK